MNEQRSTASPDRTNEFLLVRCIRNYVKLVGRNISEGTAKDYTQKYQRMKRTGYLPENAGTKRAFYAYRAALLYGVAQEALAALNARDKAAHGSDAWESAMHELERSRRLFERYPPDPNRKHYAIGSTSFTWLAVSSWTGEQSRKASGTRSKKQVVSVLRKFPEWQEMLWMAICPKYRDSLAVVALTGARPSELANGVSVNLEYSVTGEKFLMVKITGTKVTTTTGQPERTLRVRTCGAIAQHLAARVGAQNGEALIVQAKPANLTAAVIKAGRRAFPSIRPTVTPYVLRHAVASDAKRQSKTFSPVEIAQLLGHRATETQQYYGYASCASGESQIVGVHASAHVRMTHRNPANAITVARATAPALPWPHM